MPLLTRDKRNAEVWYTWKNVDSETTPSVPLPKENSNIFMVLGWHLSYVTQAGRAVTIWYIMK